MPPRPSILNAENWRAQLQAQGSAPCSVLRLNLDGWSLFLASRGKSPAEATLRTLERAMSEALPSDAIIGRIGTNEYGVILPETSPESALKMSEHLLRLWAARRPSDAQGRLGLSGGVATAPIHAKNAHDLLGAAGEALARAKREGRGRVCLHLQAKMVLKSNYYPRGTLERLKRQARREGRSEAEILREALERYLQEKTL